MSIQTQKILRFIPLVNFIVWNPGWFLTAKKCNTNTKAHLFKSVLIEFALLIVIFFPLMFLSNAINIPKVTATITLLQVYLIGLAFACVSLWDQEKMLKEHEQNKW